MHLRFGVVKVKGKAKGGCHHLPHQTLLRCRCCETRSYDWWENVSLRDAHFFLPTLHSYALVHLCIAGNLPQPTVSERFRSSPEANEETDMCLRIRKHVRNICA